MKGLAKNWAAIPIKNMKLRRILDLNGRVAVTVKQKQNTHHSSSTCRPIICCFYFLFIILSVPLGFTRVYCWIRHQQVHPTHSNHPLLSRCRYRKVISKRSLSENFKGREGFFSRWRGVFTELLSLHLICIVLILFYFIFTLYLLL